MLHQQRLKTFIHYCIETGHFTHLTNTTHKKVGDRAGFLHSKGYRHICVAGKEYKEHRIAFLYMLGEMPEEVDHINRCKDDNRWINLRKANRHINCTNQGLRHDNTSGVKGVSFKQSNKYSQWVARKQINGVKYEKAFASKEDAEAYLLGLK